MIDVYKQYSSHVMATERLKIKKRICLPRSWCLSCEGSLTCYGDNRLLFGFQCNLRRPMVFTIIRKPLVMELSLTVLMILRFVATGIQILDLLHAQRVLQRCGIAVLSITYNTLNDVLKIDNKIILFWLLHVYQHLDAFGYKKCVSLI